jgi:hypothetical protein
MALAVALLALLVALFTLVALVAVYARVRQLEAGRAVELSGYASLTGRPAPPGVHPAAPDELTVVAVVDEGCVLCHAVWSELAAIADELPDARVRLVAVAHAAVDRNTFPPHPRVELLVDAAVRADLFEGYSPTLLTVDRGGRIGHRSFVYQDTDVRSLLHELIKASAALGGRRA